MTFTNRGRLLLTGAAFILVAAVHAAYLYLPLPLKDGGTYLLAADKILAGQFFFSGSGDTFPLLYRTPGYPLFLALVSFLPGTTQQAAALLQHLIGLLSAFLVYRIAMLVWARRPVAAAGALFAALHFHFPYFESYMLSETLSIFLACLALFLALSLRGAEKAGPAAFGLCGLAAACAGLCRPELLLLAVLCSVYFWTEFKSPAAVRAGHIAAYLLPVLLLAGAWTLRNGLLYDYWGLTPNSQVAFFDGPAGRGLEPADVEPDVVSSQALKHRYSDGLVNRAVTFLAENGVAYQWSAKRIGALSFKSVTGRPGRYFLASCRQLGSVLSLERTWPPQAITESIPDLFTPGRPQPQPAGFLYLMGTADGFLESVFLAPLFLAGCVIAVWPRRSKAELLLAAVPLGLLLIYAFFSPISMRYRIVAEPFMGLLAANAAYLAFLRLRGVKTGDVPENAAPAAAWFPGRWAVPALLAAFCCWAWFLAGVYRAEASRALSNSPEAAAILRAEAAGRAGPDELTRLGYIAKERGLYPAALRYFDLALARAPEDKAGADGRADVLFRMGRGREARAELDRLAERYPEAADVQYNMGHINYLSGEREKALANIEKALKAPGLPPAIRGRMLLMREELLRERTGG